MSRVVVLGAGMVGAAMAVDSATSHHVRLGRPGCSPPCMVGRPVSRSRRRWLDLSDERSSGRGVPGRGPGGGRGARFHGLPDAADRHRGRRRTSWTSRSSARTRSRSTPWRRQRGVTAVVDCGVAPGLSNMMLGYHASRGRVGSYRCLVGGLPVKRTWPWQYKAPFSPVDVLEEYTRPARLVEDGCVVTRPALSEPELVDLRSCRHARSFQHGRPALAARDDASGA